MNRLKARKCHTESAVFLTVEESHTTKIDKDKRMVV